MIRCHQRFTVLVFSVGLFIFVFQSISCGKKNTDEPTKYQSQAGLEALTRQAQQSQPAVIKNNPVFLGVRDIRPQSAEVGDLDSKIRSVLKKLFGDAKLIEESKAAETKKDGEVVENSFIYVVSKTFVPKDGETLHSALHAAHFGLSPRLGGKPTVWSGGAMMSLFKTTSLRTYSLVIKLDSKKQQIIVESYRLGSKYDRLM